MTSIERDIEDAFIQNVTISPLRRGTDCQITIANLTIKQNMWQCRRTDVGKWVLPNNLNVQSDVTITPGAGVVTLAPYDGSTFIQDTRKLWNTDNQAVSGTLTAQLEGARFQFTWIGGAPSSDYSGMQGGIVTSNRLVDPDFANSWVNFPVLKESEAPDFEAFEQKIDLGWSVEGNRLCFYKNSFVGNTYKREYLGASILIPLVAIDRNIEIGFRPLKVGTNYGWEIFYRFDAIPYSSIDIVKGTTSNGTFPIGHYNGTKYAGLGLNTVTVSYTHLTLPTIYSV